MYNIFKNKIYSYFYYSYVKDSYNLISKIPNKEEVYFKNNKLFVLVKDDKIGKEIFQTLKYLENLSIRVRHKLFFRIEQYVFDKNQIVKWFCIKGDFKTPFHESWNSLSNWEKLRYLLSLLEDMQRNGLVLDKSKFDCSKCNCISEVLSFFIQSRDDEDIERSKECVIKYIHYELSYGGNLENFYQNLDDTKVLFKIYDFPYSLPVIKACYNYYKKGEIPEDIYKILEQSGVNVKNEFIAVNDDFNIKYQLTEENEEYSIYDNSIKIFHSMTNSYQSFLKGNSYFFEDNKLRVFEKIDRLVIDLDGNIIGYTFSISIERNFKSILEKEYFSQRDILDFFFKMMDFFDNFNIPELSSEYIEHNDEFNIEDDLVCHEALVTYFLIPNFEALYKLSHTSRMCIRGMIIVLFFKIFLGYITQKYGKLTTKQQYMEILEIRVLPPILAREFVKFAMNKKVDYDFASKVFGDFRDNYSGDPNNDIYFYSRFEYVPSKIPFIFDYEVESKYHLKLEKGMRNVLSDGKNMVIFKRNKTYHELSHKERRLCDKIHDKIGFIETSHVKIVRISEVIYSSKLDDVNMYFIKGYITEPIVGRQLSQELLMSLNNRELYLVIGYLLTKFSKYYIPLSIIYMDDNWNFYINIWDKDFCIKRLEGCNGYGKKSQGIYVQKVIEALLDNNYNSNAFSYIDSSDIRFCGNQENWIKLSENLTKFCEEHQIYYDENKAFCPICSKTKFLVSQGLVRMLYDEVGVGSFYKLYRVDDLYHLKLYNDLGDMASKIEDNIDTMIKKVMIVDGTNESNSSLALNQVSYCQDCFLPVKKAFNKNNHFVGYLYKEVSFDKNNSSDELCVDLKDTDALKNLPRLKSLIRLLLQVEELTQQGLGFYKNPFSGGVYLNPGHKKQVQILNIDLLCQGNIDNTIKWTMDYVYDVLDLDDSIETASLSKKYFSFDILLSHLQSISEDMTKYCSIHKIYYKNQYVFCPRCMSKELMDNLSIVYDDEDRYVKKKPINEGGESFIYPYDGNNLVIKVFKKEKINIDYKLTVIARILNKQEELIDINNKCSKFEYIIPQKLIQDRKSHVFFAYVMKEVKGQPISSLKYKDEIKKLNFTRRDILEILITIGTAIEILHKMNIFIGDLNGRNILFDKNKKVYFLDFDGMGVDEISPEFCTDTYIDPLSKKNKNITVNDDWYSFAIQAFHYLVYTHPFNGIYYVEENGIRRTLRVTEMMERRISFLGNHGLKLPEIAESWRWMTKELKSVLLNTFEGERRESMVPELIRQYQILYMRKFSEEEVRKKILGENFQF